MDTEPPSSVIRPNRRTVALAAAWSAPVIMLAAPAPAYAASRVCAPTALSWKTVAPNTVVPSGTKYTVGKTVVTYTDTGATGTQYNSMVTSIGFGGYAAGETMAFTSPNNTTNTTQTITFAFNSPVTNVSLTIVDIDWDGTYFNDRIVVNTPGFTYARNSGVTGTGTTASPFRALQSIVGGVPTAGTAGNVTITWAGPVTSVSFSYSQAALVTGNATIAMSGVKFTPTVC